MSLLKTSLHEKHLELKAKMSPFAGFDMPLQYSGVKDEVAAVRGNVGIFDVSHMGEFFVEGNEANKFIDHMMTNHYQSSPVGKAVYSPICREDGTVIDDLIAYKLSETKSLICVNAANIKKDFDWMQEHVRQFDCTLTDHSSDYSLLAIQGPKTEEILRKLSVLPDQELEYYSAIEYNDMIIARTGYTGEDGFELFASHQKTNELFTSLINEGATPCGLASRDVLRIEVAYPLYGNEIHDANTPLDAALKWTVKLQKEKFLGKDALSKIDVPSYKLAKLSLEKQIPRASYKITNGNGDEIGEVTSGTFSPTLGQGIALAKIQTELFPKDKTFYINIRNQQVVAKYHTKAFVSGGHK